MSCRGTAAERRRRREARYDEIAEAYIFGDLTLEQVGRQYGLTRERVRQIVAARTPGWLVTFAAQRRSARARVTRALVQYGEFIARQDEPLVDCEVCGRDVEDRGHIVLCRRCRQFAMIYRNHVTHRRVDRLAGKGRWLVAGSESEQLARRARTECPELYALLPESIRCQVETGDWKGRPTHPCEECGVGTINARFCSRDCFIAHGIGVPVGAR